MPCLVAPLAARAGVLGVCTLESYPVAGREIARVGIRIPRASCVYGHLGGDSEFGALGSRGDATTGILDALRAQAEAVGLNAVTGARLDTAFSSDAVFASGQTRRSGGRSFDYSAACMATAYGTPAQIECP